MLAFWIHISQHAKYFCYFVTKYVIPTHTTTYCDVWQWSVNLTDSWRDDPHTKPLPQRYSCKRVFQVGLKLTYPAAQSGIRDFYTAAFSLKKFWTEGTDRAIGRPPFLFFCAIYWGQLGMPVSISCLLPGNIYRKWPPSAQPQPPTNLYSPDMCASFQHQIFSNSSLLIWNSLPLLPWRSLVMVCYIWKF